MRQLIAYGTVAALITLALPVQAETMLEKFRSSYDSGLSAILDDHSRGRAFFFMTIHQRGS